MDLDSPVNVIAPNIGRLELSALAGGGRLRIRDNDKKICAELGAGLGTAVLALGGSGFNGHVTARNAAGVSVIQINGRDQDIRMFNADGDQTINIDGSMGDIKLIGGDTAEQFDIEDEDPVAPGSVMVIVSDGRLGTSRQPYDRRVAGVVSGAGSLRPGIVLGALTPANEHQRGSVALAGRVHCRVDATPAPIGVGDLLTTSTTPGHAMKASDSGRAFGAVLGKSLAALPSGLGLVPILVALQ